MSTNQQGHKSWGPDLLHASHFKKHSLGFPVPACIYLMLLVFHLGVIRSEYKHRKKHSHSPANLVSTRARQVPDFSGLQRARRDQALPLDVESNVIQTHLSGHHRIHVPYLQVKHDHYQLHQTPHMIFTVAVSVYNRDEWWFWSLLLTISTCDSLIRGIKVWQNKVYLLTITWYSYEIIFSFIGPW